MIFVLLGDAGTTPNYLTAPARKCTIPDLRTGLKSPKPNGLPLYEEEIPRLGKPVNARDLGF